MACPDVNSPAAATLAAAGIAGSGLQAGPSAITSFTAVNMTSGLAGNNVSLHPSFIIGTMAARTGAPPFFRNNAGGPPSASSAMNPVEGSPAPSLLGRVGIPSRYLEPHVAGALLRN